MTLQEARPNRTHPRRRRFSPALAVAVLLGLAALLVTLRGGPSEDAGPPASPPGFADLWQGRASLVLDKEWTSASLGAGNRGGYGGAHVEVVGGTWYLFNRQVIEQPCGDRGPSFVQMGTQVRSSTDRGATWGPATTILAPTPGTAWACAATDGDAVYDAGAMTWRYLFQCLGTSGEWHGCYAERRDADPMGPFTAPTPDPNPVIAPGKLWDRICDDAGDDCRRETGQHRIVDEGTYNIFHFDGRGWWVGFHGFDRAQGYRGIARTTTFRRGDWQVDGEAGTPTDAVVDAADAARWREDWEPGGPVGAGAASIMEENGYFYELVEVPDVGLECLPGQSWDLGLFRTRRLSSSAWEQYPGGNPLVYSSRAPEVDGKSRGCNVNYPGLFKDAATGTAYVLHGRSSSDPATDGIYVYRLEWNRSLLENGDFARADAHGWHPWPGTSVQLTVDRLPDGSPDGTPYLALSCGAPACDGGQSLYQDVDAGKLAGKRLAFGGAFRTESGAGRLDVALLQLDEGGRVIKEEIIPVTTSEAYVAARGELEVDERARRLRFQLYPRTPEIFRADQLYVIPQQGCAAPRYPAC